MIIEKYNIRLRSLNMHDLEMVRGARNSDFIRSRMMYREIISPEQQLQWYRSLDAAADVFMIIEYDGKPRGMINVKNIDYTNDSSESGVFFWDKEVLNSFVPVMTSWLAAESGYLLLGGQQTLIHVLKNNKNAIEFNQGQGYRIIQDAGDVVLMRQTKSSFSQATLSDRMKYIRTNNANPHLMLSFGDHDQDDFRQTNLMNYLKLLGVSPAKQSGRTFWFEVAF
ncbi:hypothetical protein DSECCO2_600860 [anaerobic digester metagenome]